MARDILHKAWYLLTRMNVAAILILILLLLAALGSCFPQLPESAAAAGRLAGWQRGIQARYGPLADLLAAGGAFRWFRAPLFLVSLALLALATLVCTLDRWRAVWRRAFHHPLRPTDTTLETAPYTATLSGPSPHVVRRRLEGRGFRVRSETAADVLYLRADRNRLSPLATLVTHLGLLLLLLGALLSSSFGWREELAIAPGQSVEVGHGSRLVLRNDGFAIDRYPDGTAAGYRARVALIQAGRELRHANLQVNRPLAYRGVGFYLRGYEEREGRHSLALLAVRDPGYGPVIAAAFLLLLGMTVSFNFPHCWIHARIRPDGTLHLAGRAGRHACDFGHEFTALVEELVPQAKEGAEPPC